MTNDKPREFWVYEYINEAGDRRLTATHEQKNNLKPGDEYFCREVIEVPASVDREADIAKLAEWNSQHYLDRDDSWIEDALKRAWADADANPAPRAASPAVEKMREALFMYVSGDPCPEYGREAIAAYDAEKGRG